MYPQIHNLHRIRNRIYKVQPAGDGVVNLTKGLHDADLGLIHDLNSANQHCDSKDGNTAADDRAPDDAENLQPLLIVLVFGIKPLAQGGGDGKASS